uniref:Tyr recombinase domain-containing protein n=1 Tax=Chlamydia trachomatis TaxID=813 RepID=Q46428_CHLTH|nr:unknown protein [Chlamydia trachomatis]
MKSFSLFEVIMHWTASLNKHTCRSYRGSFLSLEKIGLLSLDMNLQEFSLLNHNLILDAIKKVSSAKTSWTEGTKQVRAGKLYFLNKIPKQDDSRNSRYSGNLLNKKIVEHFLKPREIVKTDAMNSLQTASFLKELKKINARDWLIAQTMLQGGKRSSEVLSLEISQICFQQATISFSQLKNRQTEKRIIITYPQKFMHFLQEYIGQRRGFVFVTRSGKMVGLRQIARTFSQAGLQAAIPFKITPHVLRATAVTEYKRLGAQTPT